MAPCACCPYPFPHPHPQTPPPNHNHHYTSHFSPMTTPPMPRSTGFIHLLNRFFWTVAVTTTDNNWVNISISLLSKHVFFIAFNSITQNIHNKTNHFICSEAPCCHSGVEIWSTLKTQQFLQLKWVLGFKNTIKTVSTARKLLCQQLHHWSCDGTPPVSQHVALNWVVMYPHQNVQLGMKGLKEVTHMFAGLQEVISQGQLLVGIPILFLPLLHSFQCVWLQLLCCRLRRG